MKLLKRWAAPSGPSDNHAVLLFGLGLVGGPIEEFLRRNGWGSKQIDYDWSDGTRRTKQRAHIAEQVASWLAGLRGTAEIRLDTVWAAGRNGFDSSAEAMAAETALLAEVLEDARRLLDRTPDAEHSFHLISSAGGLFEGQVHIENANRPVPTRAYGVAKLQQERLVAGLPDAIRRMIYRPSSVYGYRSGARVGLFSALLRGALENRTARIFGLADTLRDYVYNEDIGRFVVERILLPRGQETCVLASGKPTSTYEAIHLIESVTRTRLYLQYDPAPRNALPMSFRPSALPRDWKVTPIETGIHRTMQLLRESMLVRS